MWGRGIAGHRPHPRPVEPLEAKAAPLNPMCILALPLENGFGLGAHASSVLIDSIGVPQLYR
jgi:hypothetical protein